MTDQILRMLERAGFKVKHDNLGSSLYYKITRHSFTIFIDEAELLSDGIALFKDSVYIGFIRF